MASFSYTDSVRAALASCLPYFTTPRSRSTLNPSLTETPSELRPAGIGPTSSADLEHLLHDPDSDALSLHSNLGAATRRRARHRRQPKFSLTLFGYTLFGRPPIYLSDDEDDSPGVGGGRARAVATASSSTLDSDAAPLDASTIERLTSPDHYAALVVQRERERQQLEAAEATRRRAERRARRQERKVHAKAEALMSRRGALPRPDMDTHTFEGFQGSGDGMVPTSFLSHHTVNVVPDHWDLDRLSGGGNLNDSHSGDADDADLGGEFYTQKKKSPAALSASGSDSRSRTSASFSGGDAFHTHNIPIHTTYQSVPYPHTEMHLPRPVKKSHRTSKPRSAVSSVTSQSTSTAPYTPVENIAEAPAVAAFPVPQERYIRDGERADFPSVGLSGKRKHNLQDLKTFLAHQG